MINTVAQGGAGSQPVSLGGWVAQIRKDLGMVYCKNLELIYPSCLGL